MPKRLTLDEMHQLANSRGGECLSAAYVNSDTKLPAHISQGVPDVADAECRLR